MIGDSRFRYLLPVRIIGHGVDIVDVGRIARMLDEHGERFLNRVYTPGERSYADASVRRAEHFAARFAAKEAAMKALGIGWTRGVAWTDIEVAREPSGRPTLRVGGAFAREAARLNVAEWWLSLSHADTHAVASVIAVAG